MLTALVFVFLCGPWIIDHLRLRQGKGQPIREDGPQSHLATKRGTPTMGGLMILSGVTVSTVLWANPSNPYVWIVLGVTLSFGLIGFYDDYLKVTKQTHGGFAGGLRLIIEGLVALAACWALMSLGRPPFATSLTFPFFKELVFNLSWFFLIFGAFIIVGAGNAVNLTDGLDGLAAGSSAFTFAAFMIIAFTEFRHPTLYGVLPAQSLDQAIVAAAMFGACAGFLWWNAAPARIIMGDTGSLAIGGAMAGLALMTRTALLLPILAGLPVIETLSVIAQVVSYRGFRRRVLRMAPIHHHFEVGGWSEFTVTVRFWLFAGICVALAIGIFYADFLHILGDGIE